jgi:hypothetical protein
MVTDKEKETSFKEKLREKLLSKINEILESKESEYLHVEYFDHKTAKKAYIKKAFQVLGQLFSIEMVFTQKLRIEGGQFFIPKEHYLIRYNSRSFEGGYQYNKYEDIANALGLTIEDVVEIYKKLEELSKLTKKDIAAGRAFYMRQIEKSSKKILI